MARSVDKKPAGFLSAARFFFSVENKKPSCFLLPSSPCTPPRTWSAAGASARAAPPVGAPPAWPAGPLSNDYVLRFATHGWIRPYSGLLVPLWHLAINQSCLRTDARRHSRPQRPGRHGAGWRRCASVHSLTLPPVCFAATLGCGISINIWL